MSNTHWVLEKYRVVFVHQKCNGVAFFSRMVPLDGKLPRWFECRYEDGTIPNWRSGTKCGNCKTTIAKPHSSSLRVSLGIQLDKKTRKRYNREAGK